MKTIKRAIERFLNSQGYYKADMPEGSAVSEAEIMEMFRTYGQNEVFKRLLRDLCAQDVRVAFQLPPDAIHDRGKLQGAYGRTSYFMTLINKANDKRKRSRGN
jgi:hypothetical protein